jgi:hypothetical protein
MLLPTTSYDPELKPEFTTEVALEQNCGFPESYWYRFHMVQQSSTDQIAPLSLPLPQDLEPIIPISVN